MVEIIHTATLVHDDIIDEAQNRRGRPAANTQWGNAKCVLAGDWLYMQAFKIAVQERNFAILDALIELTQAMVEGELLQIERLGKAITMEEHFELICRKTACLFSVCMKLGGILAGASDADQTGWGSTAAILAWRSRSWMTCLTSRPPRKFWANRSPAICAKAKPRWQCCTRWSTAPWRSARRFSVLSNGGFNGITPADIVGILNRNGSIDAASRARSSSATRHAKPSAPSRFRIKRVLLWVPEFVVEREILAIS